MLWSREHVPLINGVCAALLVCAVGLSIDLQRGHLPSLSTAAVLWFFGGLVYTHLFEYAYHRIGMHHFYDPRHLKHHQVFAGGNFQSRDADALREIATAWYIFPVLFAVHYAAFLLFFPARSAAPFFLGVSLQFLFYEISHWFTHVRDNRFDAWVRRIPLLRNVRAWQIEHHRIHHETPVVNYNFTPPYAGDRLAKTYRCDKPQRSPSTGSSIEQL